MKFSTIAAAELVLESNALYKNAWETEYEEYKYLQNSSGNIQNLKLKF